MGAKIIPISMAPQDENGPSDWFSLSELLALNLPGLPDDRRKLSRKAQDEAWHLQAGADGQLLSRARGRVGGGVEFHVSVLPPAAQLELSSRGLSISRPQPAEAETAAQREWRWFDRQTDKVKNEAKRRAAVLMDIDMLEDAGMTRSAALGEAARKAGIGASTVWNWVKAVSGIAPSDRLPFLAPRRKGGGVEADIPDDIWRIFLSDYLRPERPTLKSCYDRVVDIAEERRLNQALPSEAAFRRRLERDVDARVLLKRRGKKDEFKRSVPDQRRTLETMNALDLVNIDGHMFDVFVIPPDGGDPIRPVLVAIQDVYSRKFLAWKLDLSENFLATRLAFADLFKNYGIPKACLLDNSRTFAGKKLTGGAHTRFRYKHVEGEAAGLLTSLGIQIRFAKIYHGQAKPIERGFRDFADRIARSPECAGAYTGNSPTNKPANYGERAIPWAEFEQIVERGIAQHNARTGRRGGVCNGRSFDQVFAESYANGVIGKATPEQLRIALLAAEQKRVNKLNGEINLYRNRYWSEECGRILGQRVTVRFDPEDLHKDIYVYDLSGAYLFAAQIMQDSGFTDLAGAHAAAKRRKQYVQAVKTAEEAHDLMLAHEVAALQAKAGVAPELPEPGAVRMHRHRGNVARKAKAAPQVEAAPQREISVHEERNFAALGKLRIVE